MLSLYMHNNKNKANLFPIEYVSKKLKLENNTTHKHFVECKAYITRVLNNSGLKIVKNRENVPLFYNQLSTLISKSEKNTFVLGLIKKSLTISSAIELNPDILFSIRVKLNTSKNNNLNATVENLIYIIFRNKNLTEEEKNKIKLLEDILFHKEVQEHFSVKKEVKEDSITICLEPKYFDVIPEGDYSVIEMF